MTKQKSFAVVGVLCGLLLSCTNEAESKLKDAISITINYMLPNFAKSNVDEPSMKTLSVTESKAIEKLLDEIDFSGPPRNLVTGPLDYCVVIFLHADGTSTRAKFLDSRKLQCEGSRLKGIVDLKTADFYRMVCELISREEGRQVDPLRDNRGGEFLPNR